MKNNVAEIGKNYGISPLFFSNLHGNPQLNLRVIFCTLYAGLFDLIRTGQFKGMISLSRKLLRSF
jgi:hypothetical protein